MKENVNVGVRLRPIEDRGDSNWTITSDGQTIIQDAHTEVKDKNRRRAQFSFDHIFPTNSKTEKVYDSMAESVIFKAMEGYNGTIFAYGQTNSGKTHTMKGHPDDPGLIPLALQDVFSIIEETPDREFLLRVSYLEIYNETINDLLAPGEGILKISENKQRGVYIDGLKESVVVSLDQVMTILASGEAHRHVGRTNYNLASSRSHTLLQLLIESKQIGATPSATPVSKRPGIQRGPQPNVCLSTLNLIDLAGSERIVDDAARRKEGVFINRSLLTLGTVISKLSEGSKGHVPFRDSKLTRILQNSLSGNAHVGIICTINPDIKNSEETIKTMLFAQRSKKISTKAHLNELTDDSALLKQYKTKIKELEKELGNLGSEKITELQSKNQQISAELEDRKIQTETLKERISQLTKMILHSSNIQAKVNNTPANEAAIHIRQARSKMINSGRAGMENYMDDPQDRNRNSISSLTDSMELDQLKAELDSYRKGDQKKSLTDKDELQVLVKEISDLKRANKEFQETIEKMKVELREKDSKINDSEFQIMQLESKLAIYLPDDDSSAAVNTSFAEDDEIF